MHFFTQAWKKKRVFWTSAGLFALLAGAFLSRYPDWCEKVYGAALFPLIRGLFRYSLALLPFPAVILVAFGGVALFWWTAVRPALQHRWTWWTLCAGVCSTVGALIFLFQALWGFNYDRRDISQRLGIEKASMTTEDLEKEFNRATDEVLQAADAVHDLHPLDHWSSRAFEEAIAPELRRALKVLHYPLTLNPRVRILRPMGILMRWNTAGIYLPFSGEGHVDAGMLPVQIPFTMAHEMAHGFGVTGEGDCNFLAYLSCRQSGDPFIHFAGVFTYWRYVASEFRDAFPERYKERYGQFPDIIRNTLWEIHANDARYPDILPKLRNAIYDTYLRSEGVHEGLRSYNKVVQLVWAYESRQANR